MAGGGGRPPALFPLAVRKPSLWRTFRVMKFAPVSLERLEYSAFMSARDDGFSCPQEARGPLRRIRPGVSGNGGCGARLRALHGRVFDVSVTALPSVLLLRMRLGVENRAGVKPGSLRPACPLALLAATDVTISALSTAYVALQPLTWSSQWG